MGNLAVDWILTTLFAATGGYCLLRLLLGRSWIDRIHNAAHVAMSVVMLAMPWTWYAGIPVTGQIIVFSAVAGWYIWLALLPRSVGVDTGGGSHQHGPLLWYHAVMMAAMAWMAVAMASMQNMSSAMNASSMSSRADQMPGIHLPTAAVSRGVGVFFAVSAALFVVWLIAHAVRPAARRAGAGRWADVADIAAYAVMAAGMAGAFLILM